MSIHIQEKACPHDSQYYQPEEKENNVPESLWCEDCGKDLDIPEPDIDLQVKEL